MQTNHTSQFESVEANLAALRAKLPQAPTTALFICRMIMLLGRDMSSRLEQQIRPHGLAEAEFRVLMSLYTQPDGLAQSSEVAAAASQSAANMSRISDALVMRGLVTRDGSAQDRRRMLLRITDGGIELVQRLLPALFLPLHGMLQEFSDAEQVQVIAQLRRLGAALDVGA